MATAMELRHLRYFVAVAEEGSVTLAAQRRLHTAQPSLSRQMRELEREVGAQLLVRSTQGVELTPAGRAFLDHARLALSQVETAGEAARRAAQPTKATFIMGFLTGTEIEWFSEAVRLIRDELPSTEVVLVSQTSPELVDSLMRRKVDVAFLRSEPHTPDLEYRHLRSEPLVVVLPTDHRLATRDAIDPREIKRETFVNVSDTAPALRVVIDEYLRSSRLDIVTAHEAASMSMAISLVASTKGVALLPFYALNFLPSSVTSRPLIGAAPTIDLVLGYHKANTSPLLKLFLSRKDDLIARVAKNPRSRP
jgi:LysR family transcriptional regulator, hca operon transcriptional activator